MRSCEVEEGTVSTMSCLLELQDVSMDFGGIRALSRCSFKVNEGEVFSLIGPNGAGKTTLFNIVSGIYKPTAGRVSFRGKRIDKLRASRVGCMGMARSFQNIELFNGMTALENVLVGHHHQLHYGFFSAFFHAPKVRTREREGAERVRELLESFGIAEFEGELVEDLPYGVQKKIEIARALATEPKLLLLDEPAAGLNDAETIELMATLRRVREQTDITLLIVEHNMRFVMGLSDRVCVLNFGQVLAEGSPDHIQAHPDVIAAYLGDAEC